MSTRGPDIPQGSRNQQAFPDIPAGQSQSRPPGTLLDVRPYLFSPPSACFTSFLSCPPGIFLKKHLPTNPCSGSAPGTSTGLRGQGRGCHVPQAHGHDIPALKWAKRHRTKDPVGWTAVWQNDPVFSPGRIFFEQFRWCINVPTTLRLCQNSLNLRPLSETGLQTMWRAPPQP